MVNLVTHRESKEARQRAHKLIEEVRKHKKIETIMENMIWIFKLF